MQDGNELWRRFDAVCLSNRPLLQHVLSLLQPVDRNNLRLGSQRLREAVNGAVDKILYILNDGSLRTDLSTVFPAATELMLDICPIEADADARSVKATDVFLFLQHVTALNPVLLPRLTRLAVDVVLDGAWADTAQAALCRLLSRCISLQGLEVTWMDHAAYLDALRPNEAAFAGQGSTPEQRRSHMQEQLHSLAHSPVFLAPTSWSTHQCLVRLEALHGLMPPFNTLCVNAMSVSSLTRLVLQPDNASQLAVCDGFSHLSQLQKLSLYACNSAADASLNDVLQEVARLASLQDLFIIDRNVLGSAGNGTIPSIPSSWSQLTALTHLTLCTIAPCS